MPFFSRIKKGFGFNQGINELDKTNRGEVVPIATNRLNVTVDCKMTIHPPSPSPDKENGSENDLNCIDNVAYSTVVPKKVLESSELLSVHTRGRGTKSPSSAQGRKSSDMKYSSVSPPTRQARVPSAWSISDRCFPNGDSLSTSSPGSSLADSYDEQFESYTLDENEASPESRAIMEEMDQIYQSSPMPESYLTSPPKKLQLLPEIVLPPKPMPMTEEGTIVKVNIDASELLAKQDRREQRGGTNKDSGAESYWVANDPFATRIADAKSASGGPRRNAEEPFGKSKKANMNGNRRNSSAPNAASREWDMPSEKGKSSVDLAPSIAITTKRKPLTVQREEDQRNQRAKDAKSAPNERDGRRNLDKRTARLRFADAFKADIMQHRQRQPYLNCGTNHSDKSGSQIQDRGMNGVSIAVRKRPMFDYELDRGDYDVVSIDNTNEGTHDITTVHNCVMHADMKRMYMKPTSYPVTAAFDEHCRDDDVYRHIAKPLVINSANDGVATILMYGQTGCGKSHTMSGIETRASQGLFQAIDFRFAGKPHSDRPTVTIQFVELCGSKVCNDLLVKNSCEVKLVDAEDGSVHLLNATSIEVQSSEELFGQIMLAKGRRATEATDMNGVSSRSHAVCQIEIKCKQPGSNRGLLTLIDCAGSERSHDSMYHTSERQKESAEINASLYSLKECIRARANKNERIPFRSSNLTRILKESFERDGARLCVIACVAPNATDTEHTMETLKTVASIVGVDDQIKEEKAHEVSSHLLETKPTILPPSGWDHEHLKKFLALKKMERVLLTEKHDGKLLMKMSVPQMRAQLFDDRDKDLAQKLFDLLRKENDRVTAIQRKERAILKKERKERV